MKKILFVSDSAHFPEGAFHFAEQLRGEETIVLKGIFFNELEGSWMAPELYDRLNRETGEPKVKQTISVVESSNRFIEKCRAAGIRYETQHYFEGWDRNFFSRESRFADLAILSEDLFCPDLIEGQPNLFMQQLLQDAECPVIALPESFQSIDHIVVAYDGNKESVFALKQFTNLLPGYQDLPIEFVYLREEESEDLPDGQLLQAYTNAHYDAGNAIRLHFLPGHSFRHWLREKKNTLVVAGSFSRSQTSMLFKRSFAADLIKHHQVPVFIAHNA